MPAELSTSTPIAITARKRHYWKPYLHRRNRKARSIPHVEFDFTQAPTRVFASQPDVSVDALENELRRMSLKPTYTEDALNARFATMEARLADERRKFEDEKRQFEAERRELEERARVAEHNAAQYLRRAEKMEAGALDRALLEALRVIAERVDLQTTHIAQREEEFEEQNRHITELDRHITEQDRYITEQDRHIVEQDRYIADQEYHITSVIDEGRALIQEKDQEIAALKASMQTPSTNHAQFPVISQQSPSHFSSQYVCSNQDEQYDPSRPQIILAQSHPYHQQSLSSQQASYHYQPQSHHGYAPSASTSPTALAQDVCMD